MADTSWDPQQYEKFEAERAQPFWDLLALVQPVPGGRVIDLGCGTGTLTKALHEHTAAAATIGIDSSSTMLDRAEALTGGGLSFQRGTIEEFDETDAFDVVFANASLQWVPDHEELLPRLAAALRPGGQLAVQVPANGDHPSHTVALAVAGEPPFADDIGDDPERALTLRVLAPERYAELLHALGLVDQHVRMQVYGHVLDSTADVVEWTSGTTLVRFRRHLPAHLHEPFVARYRERLLDTLGHRSPYFYAFKRILFHGRRR